MSFTMALRDSGAPYLDKGTTKLKAQPGAMEAMRSALALLTIALFASGCLATPGGTTSSESISPLPVQGTPQPSAAAPDHKTSSFTYLQEPNAMVHGILLTISGNRLALERPDGVTRLLLECVWARYAAPAGIEEATFNVGGQDGPLNRTSVPDSRGVLALTVAPEDWTADLFVGLYPTVDNRVMGPGQYTVYATTFIGGEPPKGFTAVPA